MCFIKPFPVFERNTVPYRNSLFYKFLGLSQLANAWSWSRLQIISIRIRNTKLYQEAALKSWKLKKYSHRFFTSIIVAVEMTVGQYVEWSSWS